MDAPPPPLACQPVLLLLARPPVPGQVKTRLIPLLGAEGACELYAAFLRDTLEWAAQAARDLGMVLAVAWAGDAPASQPVPPGALVLRQEGEDLGQRQAAAHRLLASAGAGPVLFLGADSPTLPSTRLQAALTRLGAQDGAADGVVVPARDGGYVLLGLRRPLPGLFHGIPWGTGKVLSALLARASRLGLRLDRLAGWYDVDDGASLQRLRHDLARRSGAPAPCTAAVLRQQADVQRA